MLAGLELVLGDVVSNVCDIYKVVETNFHAWSAIKKERLSLGAASSSCLAKACGARHPRGGGLSHPPTRVGML